MRAGLLEVEENMSIYTKVVGGKLEAFFGERCDDIEKVTLHYCTHTHYLIPVPQHENCMSQEFILGQFRETKMGYPGIYHILGVIPGLPPPELLRACDVAMQQAPGHESASESDAASEQSEDGEEQEQAKVGAFEEAGKGGAAQEESEPVELFSISESTEREYTYHTTTSHTHVLCRRYRRRLRQGEAHMRPRELRHPVRHPRQRQAHQCSLRPASN